MNCHHFRATQKSIPDAQELIWLGGGIQCPLPSDKGLKYCQPYNPNKPAPYKNQHPPTVNSKLGYDTLCTLRHV